MPYADESDIENCTLQNVIDEFDRESDVHTPEIDQQDAGNWNETRNETENNHTHDFSQNKVNVIPSTSKKSTGEEAIGSDYEVGNFILVEHSIKNVNKYYVARIEAIEGENLSVIYLKKFKKEGLILFMYPAVHIKYNILKEEIVMKLTPAPQGNKRSALMFDIDFEKFHVRLLE